MNNYYLSIGILAAFIVVVAAAVWYKTENPQAFMASGTATSTSATSTAAATTKSGTTAGHTTTKTTVVTTNSSNSTGTKATAQAPKISAFQPAAATIGTTVTIVGTGFTPTGNVILFGTSNDRHHPDGTPDNQITTADSVGGATVSFTVPTSGPSGLLCNSQNECVGIAALATTPGNYTVTVKNANGVSNTATLRVQAQ